MKTQVRVVDAPGYEDFDAELLLGWEDWPVAVVGYEWEGEREFAVVPSSCIQYV